MYFIVPNLNGHFLNYIQMFEKRSDYDGYIILTSNLKGFLSLVKLIVSLLRSNRNNIDLYFLHGETHVVQSLLLAIFPRIRVTTIFYYGFNENLGFLKSILSRVLVFFLSVLSVRMFYLEKPEDIIIASLRDRLLYLPDPVLVPYSLNVKHRSNDIPKVLIAGYLDSRKCIDQVLVALDTVIKGDFLKEVEVYLVGEQSFEVSKFLDSYLLETHLTVIQNNKRVTDDELARYIERSDIVSCVYSNHLGSSGMFLNAIAYNKKVLFVSNGVLEDFAVELDINVSIQKISTFEIVRALHSLLDDEYSQYSMSARANFLAKRSKSSFINLLCGG